MRAKLLLIAPNVPLFDRFAGDLRLFTILNMLSKSYEISYFAKNWATWAVDKALEKSVYVSRLNDIGISVYYGESHTIKDLLKTNTFEISIMEFYHVAEQYLPRIRLLQPACKIIIDTVDLHYLRLHRKFKLTNDINDYQLAEATKAKELAIYRQADIVLTVTYEDARNIIKEYKDITIRILPTVHELIQAKGTRNRSEMIFVGGFNHEPNIDAVVYFCEDILPRIRKVIKDARFTIVGTNPPQEIMGLRNDFITVTGYVPSTTPFLHQAYVSVAPLRYGAGMKGKIGEAMAHGLPVVTTSIGAEGMGLTDRKNVLIADSPETFSDAVIELMLEENLYKKIQKNSLEHIRNNFTPEKVGRKIEQILSELAGFSVKKMSLSNKTTFLLDYSIDFLKRRLPICA